MERAVTLDPLSATTLNTRARMLTERRQLARAREADSQAASLSRSFGNNDVTALNWSGLADSAFRSTRRMPASDRSRSRFGNAIMARAAAALVFGDRATAAALFVDNLENEGVLANMAFSVC